jgi:hypothetical protein
MKFQVPRANMKLYSIEGITLYPLSVADFHRFFNPPPSPLPVPARSFRRRRVQR